MTRFSVSNTVLLIICLMYLILYVDRVNISTAAPLIKADLELSNMQLGLAFSAFAYPLRTVPTDRRLLRRQIRPASDALRQQLGRVRRNGGDWCCRRARRSICC